MNDKDIDFLAKQGMIQNYLPEQVKMYNGVRGLSGGLSAAGYDTRLDTQFISFKEPVMDPKTKLLPLIDPLNFDESLTEKFEEKTAFALEPHEFLLGQTIEYFNLPDDIMCITLGKSTNARVGIILNTTPAEPGWDGKLTLEIFNMLQYPVLLHPGQGICQFIFFRTNHRPAVTYLDRGGKYSGQTEPTVAKV